MCISLFVPIETMQKKTAVKTGVPSGKTIKEVTYYLRPFIIGGESDDVSEDSHPSLGGEGEVMTDEDFISTFTLSRFRKDLMVLAVEKFPEEYGFAKKGLGPKCKLLYRSHGMHHRGWRFPTRRFF